MEKPSVLFFGSCDFVGYPVGGSLSFARNVVKAFGNRLALVGVTTDDTPVGCWVEKEFEGQVYHFFAIGRRRPSPRKPFIPAGVTAYMQYRRNRDAILSLRVRKALTGDGIALIAASNWGWENLCHISGGIRNPLKGSRYWYARPFARLFFDRWTRAMARCNLVLAAADDGEIDEFVAATKGRLSRDRVMHFPTRVDTGIFQPSSSVEARRQVGLESSEPVIVTSGRINWVKGWDRLLDAFRLLVRKYPGGVLVYVGDGEDSPALRGRIAEYGLTNCVIQTGFKAPVDVACYLNAADVFVMTSHWEGWPTAMVEALACGKPVVSTGIRAARTLVIPGENGYVVEGRDPSALAQAIERALQLRSATEVSVRLAQRYALGSLAADLCKVWPPIAG